MQPFADRIKKLRLDYDMTLKDMGRLCGISRGAVGHWENQRSVPKLQVLVLIAKHFNVSVDYLLGVDEHVH